MIVHKREIRSYVRRQGRITEAQQQALQALWPIYGIENKNEILDLRKIFECQAPIILEIGFGMGESLINMAQAEPQKNFIGIDVHSPGIGALLLRCSQFNLKNIRVLSGDALEILKEQIPDQSLDAVHLFFPDPWPKKRHHKRRIVQSSFVNLVSAKLKPGGYFHLATDWEDYATQMMSIISSVESFINSEGHGNFSIKAKEKRAPTRFEERGKRLGHNIYDLLFKKVEPPLK